MAKHYYHSLEDLGRCVAGYLDAERRAARRHRRLHVGIMLVHGAVVVAHGAYLVAGAL